MASSASSLPVRVKYAVDRALRINTGSLIARAKETAAHHHRAVPAVVLDMLWSAARHDVGFQDYVDYDFAILSRAERATYMTHPISNRMSQLLDKPEGRATFHDKIAFNRAFAPYLGREWLVLGENPASDADALQAFAERHPTFIAKTPQGSAGLGVHRYQAAEVSDWKAFTAELVGRGELLIEEVILQHDDIAAYCPGTVNTTRVTAYFDGTKTHILAAAQKFGRGAVSDQMSFGGFYTMLDDNGHARSAGYDSHENVHELHPDTHKRIADFQLPMWDEVVAYVDRIARVIPSIPYVGWDIVVTPNGPVVIEGNWAAGVYENKPSVSGIRTGHRERYRAATGI